MSVSLTEKNIFQKYGKADRLEYDIVPTHTVPMGIRNIKEVKIT